MPWVLGVGDALIDIYLEVPHLPTGGEKVLAAQTAWLPGGMVGNFLAALRRLGTACGFHGVVGDDAFGRAALDQLAAAGVAITGARALANTATAFCVVMRDASGERAIVVAPAGALLPGADDIDPLLVTTADHIHTTGADLDSALRVTALARSAARSISIDLEATALANGAERLEQILQQVDIAFVNEHAAAQLVPDCSDPMMAARVIRARGPRIVCLTGGARGAWIATADECWHAPAYSVPVVDTTGAGDCFAAAFVHGWLAGWPLREVASFAAAAAALSVGGVGGQGALPDENAVRQFLATYTKGTRQ